MVKVEIIRTAKGKNSTLSHLYIGGRFVCYLLEDRISSKKEAGLTCIAEGQYQLQLNQLAKMNKAYAARFPKIHQGMLEITGIANFKSVFLHIGNHIADTKGCPLLGHYWQMAANDFQVCQSAFAYAQMYPQLLKLLKGRSKYPIEVSNQIVEEGGQNGLTN